MPLKRVAPPSKKVAPIKVFFFQNSSGNQVEKSSFLGEEASVDFRRSDCDILIEAKMSGKGVTAQVKMEKSQVADLIIKFSEMNPDFAGKLGQVLSRIGSKANDENVRKEILGI